MLHKILETTDDLILTLLRLTLGVIFFADFADTNNLKTLEFGG